MGDSTRELSAACICTGPDSSATCRPASDGSVGLGAMVPAVNFHAVSNTEFHENEVGGVSSGGLAANGSGERSGFTAGASTSPFAGCKKATASPESAGESVNTGSVRGTWG